MSAKSFCFLTSATRNSNIVVQMKQARTLVSHGYDVTIIVSDNKPTEVIDGVTIVPSGYRNRGYLGRVLKSAKACFKVAIKINADIYQTESIDYLGVCLKLKKKGKKVFFNLLEDHPFTFYGKTKMPTFLQSIIIALMIHRMSFCFKRINCVFTVAEDICDFWKTKGVKHIQIIGNYPSLNKSYSLSKEDYLKRENRIVYFGHIYTLSRQEVFLNALSNIDNVSYLIAGRFYSTEFYGREYEKCLLSHPYWNKVEFINGFRLEDLPSILSRSTISNVLRDFKAMKSSGSLGIIKVFESMEAGLPIICSDVKTYRDIMKKYKCGILVDPLNEKQVEQAIRFLIENKEKAYEMGQEGRRAVVEKYSWDVESLKYIKIIES